MKTAITQFAFSGDSVLCKGAAFYRPHTNEAA